ncbi:MAG: V8-like Glu-specific endopeptidase [Bacteriovoracaceae bacterium]|jgi:V8-like Glu-specific endopeptidase
MLKTLLILFIINGGLVHGTIFNTDDRIDIDLIKNEEIKDLARSIPALVQKKFLKSIGEDHFEVTSRSYQDDLGFCEDEKFVKTQGLLANCSAFLVGKDIIGTAAHCIDPNLKMGLKDYAVVFDYKADRNGNSPKIILKKNVYYFKEFIKKEFEWVTLKDYALIRLTKEVEQRDPLIMSPGTRVEVGTPLFILGFPLGLPLKYQPNGEVLSVHNKSNSFRHQLDTFSVNSGSAVFNANTKEIVGIHVRGTGMNYREDKEMRCNRWGLGDPKKDWGEANFIDIAF